jgi:hypothetical protein
MTAYFVLAGALVLAVTTIVLGAAVALVVRQLRRDLATLTELNYDLQGRLMEIAVNSCANVSTAAFQELSTVAVNAILEAPVSVNQARWN